MLGTGSFIHNLFSLGRYNLRIIFGGKFAYFMLAALIFFLLFGTIMAFEANELGVVDIYGVLSFPAILLVFYLNSLILNLSIPASFFEHSTLSLHVLLNKS